MAYIVGKSVLFRTAYESLKKFYRIAAERIVIEQTVLGCAVYLISNKYAHVDIVEFKTRFLIFPGLHHFHGLHRWKERVI